MNITVDRAVIEQALEALDYVMRHGPAVQKAKDLLQDALEQPEQEPLTDDEIQAIWEKAFDSGSSPRDFARAIEAAHSRQDDYELLGYVELGGYFGVEQARKNGLSGVLAAIYVEPLLPEPNNDLTQMVPIYIKPAKEKPTT